MKKYIKNILFYCLLIITGTSCSDFWDNEPDNLETMDQVFQQKQATREFLANVYSYIRPVYEWSNQTIWTGISDELDVTYSDYEISKINLGLLAPDKEALFYGNLWSHYYKGIRAATYFIHRVDECEELVESQGDNTYKDYRPQYKLEARALRAWFYFCLIRQYGPVVIVPDNLVAADAPVSEMMIPRSSISECFEYVVNEMDSVILANVLDKKRPQGVDGKDIEAEYGRVTEAFCKAVKARALLYASSDLYNRDRTLEIFRDFKNVDGTDMMDYTESDRISLLEAAKKATEEVFSYSFSIYKQYDTDGTYNPYTSYQNLFLDEWNNEVIFAKPSGGFWEQDMACSPRFVNGWSGWGPTQEMVDAYFTKTGYPILKDANGNYYAEDGSYTEDGFSTANGDNGYTQRNTYNMYTNREPRFYISICFNNSKWMSNYDQTTVQLYYGGNTGRTDIETRNYSQTGYLCRKFVNPESDLKNGRTYEHSAVMMRLGEFYLNYAEILNELNYSGNLSTILSYLNQIRERAGIPAYGSASGQVPIPASYEEMREAIRRERRAELAFEEHRYFDCIRWAIAHEYFGGDKHGMNANDSRGEPYFHQRTVFETRVYNDYNLLWPVPQSDIYKGKLLVQNPKWSGISTATVGE